jgi:restriction system protein
VVRARSGSLTHGSLTVLWIAVYACDVGAINFSGRQFVGSFGEATGYKSGLAINEDELRQILEQGGYGDVWPEYDDQWVRIRSEALEEMFAWTLAQVGAGPAVHVVHPMAFAYHRLKHDPALLAALEDVGRRYIDFLQASMAAKAGPVDLTPFLEQVADEADPANLMVALLLVEATAAHLQQSPWNTLRAVDWENVRDLEELFNSEQLSSPHGEYFDERFANFLAANFERIDRINWRQFEGLAAEFFKQAGFQVELGPGRNDDGVDIRLRPMDQYPDAPAVVLVQCKRQAQRVEKTVVKALWADMQHEHAQGGLIVTTSSLSPGAKATRTARGWAVAEADRDSVRQFIDALRTPGNWIFLGE